MLLSTKAAHVSITLALLPACPLRNFAVVASLTFRCWATIAGGVRAIQSDSETSAKKGLYVLDAHDAVASTGSVK
jgi:hypothetical protein